MRIFVFFLFVIYVNLSYGQKWLKKIQDAVEEVSNVETPVENILNDEPPPEWRSDQLKKDTSYYNYIFSQGNRASFFANRESKQNLLLTAAKNYGEESPELELYEEVFDLNRVGELSIYINQQLAQSNFFDALKMITRNEDISKSLLDSVFQVSAIANLDSMPLTEKYALGKTLANISILIHAEGKYYLSDDFIELTTAFFEEHIGEKSIALASLYNNHAVIAQSQGKFSVAEEYFERAENIIYQKEREGMLPHSIILSNKALLKSEVGQHEEAKGFMEQAIGHATGSVRERGRDNTSFQINQGLILYNAGDYNLAERKFREILILKKKRMAKNQTDYANVENYLAATLLALDKPSEVEALLNDAIRIFEKKYSAEHPAYLKASHSLAKYYLSIERYWDAEQILNSINRSYRNYFGTNHPDFLGSLEDLAVVAWKKGERVLATSRFIEVIDSQLVLVEQYFGAMSEYEKGQYWSKVYPTITKFYNYVIENQNPELLEKMYDIHLKTKGILIGASTRVREEILNSEDVHLKQVYKDWVEAKENLILHYSYSKTQLAKLNIDLNSEEEKANKLEKELNRLSSSFTDANKLPTTTFKDVKSILNGTESAVEIISFPKYEVGKEVEKVYVALIVADQDTSPKAVILENGTALETKYANSYRNMVKSKINDQISYGKFWQPIEAELTGVNNLYLSLDGVYHQINISSLKKPDGTYVADTRNIHYYSSTREIVEERNPSSTKTATLIGFPDYGDRGKIVPLPGTKEEIEAASKIAISKGYETKKIMQSDATEENLKSIKSPRLLHIATHGFFLPEQDVNKSKVFGIDVNQVNENPMLRSGLMLAGAEYAIDETSSSEVSVANNGILTAYEALTLDLKDTDLVILSACETGLGEVKSGEGVYGLQRSFQIAGAESVIMSLWKVSDEATRTLMINFYEEWMSGKEKEEAFLNAQKSLREKYPEPYYWGAFVMLN